MASIMCFPGHSISINSMGMGNLHINKSLILTW